MKSEGEAPVKEKKPKKKKKGPKQGKGHA